MTFWGVEIKPGKPFILDSHRGKIQITQATLGTPGTLAKRSVVQCNVGDKSPVLLCALLPDKIESLPLNLQFDEEDDVTFSVLGPRSVHLTGFYCGSGSGDRDDDDSDSYGEDIVETDNEADQSADSEEEDEVSDFIDDGDTETFPPSKGRKSADDDEKPVNHKHPKKKYQVSDSDVDEVIVAKDHARFKVSESEDGDIDEKPANRKGSHKHLKKKYQVSNSDVDDEVIVVKDHARCEVHESEDEDIDEKPANNHKRLKKKYQVSDSDVDDEEIVVKDHARSEVSESKDEDLLPISHLIKKKATTESKGDANCNSEIQLGKESKEGNGSSDPAAFKKLNQDSHIQVSKTEQISESPKVSSTPSTDIGQESNVQAKKKKKRSRGEDVDAKTEQTDHDRVELKPKEEQPTAIASKNLSVPSTDTVLESDVKPKKKNRRNRCEHGAEAKNMDQDYVGVKPEEEQPSDRLFEPSKDSSVPSTDIGLENVTAKKKKRRDHGDDGYARTENMVQDHVEVQPEDVQPTDKLESVFTPKKKHRRNRGEDGDAKTKSMDQDLAGVKPEKEQLTDKLSEPSKDSSIPSNNIGLQSDVKPKKKIRRNHGEDVDAKNKDMDQDLVEIKTRKKQPNDKIINSVGHVTNQR